MKRSISYLNSVYYNIDVALFVDNLNLVIGPGKQNIRLLFVIVIRLQSRIRKLSILISSIKTLEL